MIRASAQPCVRRALGVRRAGSVPRRAMSVACALPEQPEEERRRPPLSAALQHPSNLQSALSRMQLPTFRARAESMAVHEHRGFATEAAVPNGKAVYTPGPTIGRMAVLAEVVVSKIFPAGFGWQGFSAIAESMGLEDDAFAEKLWVDM